jgi:hypothetical protein
LNTQAKGGSIPLENTDAGNEYNTIAGISATIKRNRLLIFPDTG